MSRVLGNLGNQISQKYKKGIHNGVDVVGAGSRTDEIIAHSAGKVVWVQKGQVNNVNATPGTNATYGNAVKIKHDNGYCTLYAHLSDVYVSLGQYVDKGQKIGYMGNTGRSFGAHLHFEIRQGDSYSTIINPEPYLDADLPGLSTNNVVANNIVAEWQRAMNNSYDCGLAVDGSFGPASRKAAKTYQLFWKQEEIHNEAVRFVQRKLNLLGIKDDMGNALVENGYFGANTNAAVCNYQRARNIQVDGFVGEATIEWLLKDNY